MEFRTRILNLIMASQRAMRWARTTAPQIPHKKQKTYKRATLKEHGTVEVSTGVKPIVPFTNPQSMMPLS